jgi:hypothetical protein
MKLLKSSKITDINCSGHSKHGSQLINGFSNNRERTKIGEPPPPPPSGHKTTIRAFTLLYNML